MKRIIYCLCLLFLAIIPFVYAEKTEQSETHCRDNSCTVTIYSYQKYYQEKGEWKELNENWQTTGCLEGYAYCVASNPQNYQVHVKEALNAVDAIKIITPDGEQIVYLPLSLSEGANVLSTVGTAVKISMDGNRLIFLDVFPSTDFVLKYLPSKLKEELFIREPLPFAITGPLTFMTRMTTTMQYNTASRSQYADLILSKNGQETARLLAPETGGIQDNIAQYTIAEDLIGIEVDYEKATFPLILDPTTQFNYNDIVDDGFVRKTNDDNPGTPDLYTLKRNGEDLLAGIAGCDNTTQDTYRAYSDWNVSVVLPTGARIEDINLQVTVRGIEDANDARDINITQMKRHMYGVILPTTADFNDMGGGIYNGTAIPAINEYNLSFANRLFSSANADLLNATMTDDIFTYAFRTSEFGDRPACGSGLDVSGLNITSSEGSNPIRRPKLVVTYGFIANETDGRAAVLQAINSTIPGTLTHTSQQVYVRYANGNQQLGRFDVFAQSGKQRWAFNYITEGESAVNMNNITTTFYTQEMTNLTYNEIVLEVSNFIQNTKLQ